MLRHCSSYLSVLWVQETYGKKKIKKTFNSSMSSSTPSFVYIYPIISNKMKVLRIIKKIPSLNDATNNDKTKKYNNAIKFKKSGMYFSTVRPELVELMQSIGLVQQNMHCNNCDGTMTWSPEKCTDLLQWMCPVCFKGSTSQMQSFDNYSFKEVLCVLLAWFNNEEVIDVSERLGIKKNIICELYHLATKTVEKNIKANISQWHLGGPGVIVLVDTFPDGLMNTTTSSNTPILCLAELKGLPPTMWFEALETNNDPETNRMKCLNVVQQIVQPGSIVIARRDSKLCSYDDLVGIKDKFKTLVSIESLATHNSEEQNLYDNLDVIWKESLDVCLAAQYYHHSLIQSFLFCYMWRRKFQKDGYQQLLNEISSFI